MTNDDIKFLKTKADRDPVKLYLTDGEELVAKMLFVSDTEQDVIFDIISTNRQDKPVDKNVRYRATFDNIKTVSEAA